MLYAIDAINDGCRSESIERLARLIVAAAGAREEFDAHAGLPLLQRRRPSAENARCDPALRLPDTPRAFRLRSRLNSGAAKADKVAPVARNEPEPGG